MDQIHRRYVIYVVFLFSIVAYTKFYCSSSPRDVLDNIILLVILLLLCDPITLHLQAQYPLDGAVTEMKVSLAPHASFDQKQFALTWPASEFQENFSASQLFVMTGDICNESWYLGLCFWWSGIIKLHIWDTWHRSNKTGYTVSRGGPLLWLDLVWEQWIHSERTLLNLYQCR